MEQVCWPTLASGHAGDVEVGLEVGLEVEAVGVGVGGLGMLGYWKAGTSLTRPASTHDDTVMQNGNVL